MIESTIKRVFVVRTPVDFRKGPSSLTALAYKFNLDPYEGDCLICIGKRGHAVKVLGGNKLGVWLLYRRYEGGKLSSPWGFLSDPSLTEITVAQLGMLLEGRDFVIKKVTEPFRSQE